jgi:tetratricopeptide (TPR) repeat protein
VSDDLFLSPHDSIPPAKEAAQKALELDESLPEAHVEMANVYLAYDYDWKNAEKEFKRAIELKPDYAKAHEYYAWLLFTVGRLDECIAETKKSVQLAGWNLYWAHHYDEAIAQLRKTIEMEPTNWLSQMFLGMNDEAKGDLPAAIAQFQQARNLEAHSPFPVAELAHAYAISGRRSEAEQYLKELKDWSQRTYVPQYHFADIYAGLGDREQALKSLEKSYEDRSVMITAMPRDPELDPLRSEPRFKELLRKLGL